MPLYNYNGRGKIHFFWQPWSQQYRTLTGATLLTNSKPIYTNFQKQQNLLFKEWARDRWGLKRHIMLDDKTYFGSLESSMFYVTSHQSNCGLSIKSEKEDSFVKGLLVTVIKNGSLGEGGTLISCWALACPPKGHSSKSMSFGCIGAGRHVNEHHNQKHHHSQGGKHDRCDLLTGFVHGLLSLLFVFGCLFFGLPFQLSHSPSFLDLSSRKSNQRGVKRGNQEVFLPVDLVSFGLGLGPV